MNHSTQLKALQQILETLQLSAARQTDIDFKRDGNRHFTTAIQNTKALMNAVEEEIIQLQYIADYLIEYGHNVSNSSIGIHNEG